MWKLTIEQKRYSEFINDTVPEKLILFSDDMTELTMLIERVNHCGSDCETSYKLEKVGDK